MASNSKQQSLAINNQEIHQRKQQQELLTLEQQQQHYQKQELPQQSKKKWHQRLKQQFQKLQRREQPNQQQQKKQQLQQPNLLDDGLVGPDEVLLQEVAQGFAEIQRKLDKIQEESKRHRQVTQQSVRESNHSLESFIKAGEQINKDIQLLLNHTLPHPLHDKTAIAYAIAVKKGMGVANQFKLVMLGAEGAGKTSTVHSLIGKDFQPHQPSTVGAYISNTCTVDRYYVTDWKLKEFQEHLKDIPIRYKHELREAMVEPTDSQSNQVSLNDVDMTAVQDIMQNTMVPDGKIRLVIFDLGGQEVFYEIHFLFLASCDVVFLTFNASVNLDAPVIRRQRFTLSQEVYKTRKTQTNYEIIEATLHAIYSHCGMEGNKDSLSPRIPTVILVGTHACNLTFEEKRIISETLIRCLADKPFFDHFPRQKSDAIHFIDNKKRHSKVFKHLKAVAIRAACPAINEERPVSYLKFEEKVLKISKKETEIELERASDIASNAGLDDSLESLLALLQYYNSKGILLYYPEVEELNNLIFISPQNVSDLVSCVIKTHNYAEPFSSAALRKKFHRFDEFGILEESLLDDIVKRSGYGKNIVLAFLEKFDLAVEIGKDTKFENENDSYRTPDTGRVFFIPSMLVYNEGEKYVKPEGHVDNVVLYYFPDKFLPETVFNHVLISTMKWCQNKGHHICRVLRGIGVFDFKSRKQGFTLQLCSVNFSIKCSIFVLKQETNNRDLCQQRLDLLQKHLPSFILDAHNRCISKADQPIAYMECPIQHDKNCAPHICLDTLGNDTDVWCTKENPKKLISKDAYNLLLQPKDNPDKSDEYDKKPTIVTCAVVLCPVTERCKRPTHKELNRHVVNQYATRWYQIAIELGVHIENVANIEYDHRECVVCFHKTLNTWLESDPHASWKMLEVAITNVIRAKNGLKPVEEIYGPEEQQTIRQILHSHIDPYNRHIGKAVFQGFLVHQLSAKPVHLNDGSILQQGLHHQLSSLSLSPVITAKKPPLINTADLEGQFNHFSRGPLPTRNMQQQQRGIMHQGVQVQPSRMAAASFSGKMVDEEQAFYLFTLLGSDATPIYSIHSYNEMISEVAINMMGKWEDLGRQLNIQDLDICSIETYIHSKTVLAERATLGVLTTAVYDLGQRYWNLLSIIAKYGNRIIA